MKLTGDERTDLMLATVGAAYATWVALAVGLGLGSKRQQQVEAPRYSPSGHAPSDYRSGLQTALADERQAASEYLRLARMSPGRDQGAILWSIAADERKHAELLEGLLKEA